MALATRMTPVASVAKFRSERFELTVVSKAANVTAVCMNKAGQPVRLPAKVRQLMH